MSEPRPTLVVAGGGTGGHVLAGVAVADEWRKRHGAEAPVVFVGAVGGIEEKLVPRAGYPLRQLKLGSLNRVSVGRRIRTFFQLPLSFLRSMAILIDLRPQVVIGVGGYASGPFVLMARLLSAFGLIRARTAILEQNSVPGMTNRVLGSWVDQVFCAFPGTEKGFGNRRVQVTGNPIRSSMRLMPSAPRDPFTVFIFGGSLGALGINSLVIEALSHLAELKGRLRIVHQTGEKDYDRVAQGYRAAGFEAVIEKFIHDMPERYAQASLLICRAGASTLAEIAAVGRAAILIPLPTAADNHQEVNARVFSDAGAAMLLTQGGASGADLAKLIKECMESPARVEAMEKAVTRFYRPKAAQDIVQAFES